jgi:hypothetical protein
MLLLEVFFYYLQYTTHQTFVNSTLLVFSDFYSKIIKYKLNINHLSIKKDYNYRGTVASAVIQAIRNGMNEETLMKATHPMIRKRPVWHLHQAGLDYRILLTHLNQP